MYHDNDRFLSLAPEIYGRYWKTNIHRHLGYDYATMRNWVRRVNPPPTALIVLLTLYAKLGFTYVPSENVVRKVRKRA